MATVSKRQAPLLARPDVGSLAATLGLSAACWVVAVREMNGMDMGVTDTPWPVRFLYCRLGHDDGGDDAPRYSPSRPAEMRTLNGPLRAVPLFVAPYLVVWALVGIAVFAVYRPHGTVEAG